MNTDSTRHPVTSAAPDKTPAVHRLRILTVNTHKGFTALNRRFILPELRDAVRSTQADLVFLQEVLGEHDRHANRYSNWPQQSQYEFLADSMWGDFAYGRNAVYPDGHHGNALLSKYPIRQYRNLDVSITGPERRGLLHCVLDVPGHAEVHAICVHLSLLESHRQLQLALLCQLLESLPADAPVIIAGDFNDWQLHGNATSPAATTCTKPSNATTAARPRPTRHAGRCCAWTASTCAMPAATRRRSSGTNPGRTCRITCRWR
ncbi:endonuclease/exonuclease/phosphatase family protein [Pseudomonas chlororaphis]|nr:endonuclease/exonuclease/phosphatase family protein [Pseudomonas chlororaphis]UCR84918.1 endonuclease/exonuclease/phosphatase family protein [Pseudomonas chlororaphis]